MRPGGGCGPSGVRLTIRAMAVEEPFTHSYFNPAPHRRNNEINSRNPQYLAASKVAEIGFT